MAVEPPTGTTVAPPIPPDLPPDLPPVLPPAGAPAPPVGSGVEAPPVAAVAPPVAGGGAETPVVTDTRAPPMPPPAGGLTVAPPVAPPVPVRGAPPVAAVGPEPSPVVGAHPARSIPPISRDFRRRGRSMGTSLGQGVGGAQSRRGGRTRRSLVHRISSERPYRPNPGCAQRERDSLFAPTRVVMPRGARVIPLSELFVLALGWARVDADDTRSANQVEGAASFGLAAVPMPGHDRGNLAGRLLRSRPQWLVWHGRNGRGGRIL